MSDYTHVNFKQVEDQAVGFGLSPNLEARFGRAALGLEHSGLGYFRIAPGHRPPFAHSHKTQEEIYIVVSGSGRMKIGDDIIDLVQWDAVRVAPAAMRAFEAGPEGIEYLAVGAPATPPGDGTIVPEWWTD